MASSPRFTRAFTFTPAAVGTTQTVHLMPLKKGWRINSVALEKQSIGGGSGGTIALQQASVGSAGLLAATDMTSGSAGDLVNGVGADLVVGGALVTADTTLDLVYTHGSASGTIQARIGVVYSKD